MKEVAIRPLISDSGKVTIHANEQAAREWVKTALAKRNLTYDGSAKLVFFKDELNRLCALVPEDKSSDLNQETRLIGAYNETHDTFLQKLEDFFGGVRVPRQSQLDGDKIVFSGALDSAKEYKTLKALVLSYKKQSGKKVGKILYEIAGKLKSELVPRLKKTETNDPSLQIDIKKLTEDLSCLAMGQYNGEQVDPPIRSGYVYILINDDLYEYTFAEDPENEVELCLSQKEKEDKLVEEKELYAKKTVNHHYINKIKGYCIAFAVGIAFGFVAGLIGFAFLSLASVPLLAPLGATIIGVGVALWKIKCGIDQVEKENKATIENGVIEFRDITPPVFSRIKEWLRTILHFVLGGNIKPVESAVVEPTIATTPVVSAADSPVKPVADSTFTSTSNASSNNLWPKKSSNTSNFSTRSNFLPIPPEFLNGDKIFERDVQPIPVPKSPSFYGQG